MYMCTTVLTLLRVCMYMCAGMTCSYVCMYVLTRVRFLLALELGGFGMRWYTVQEVVRGDRREGEGTGGRERREREGRMEGSKGA